MRASTQLVSTALLALMLGCSDGSTDGSTGTGNPGSRGGANPQDASGSSGNGNGGGNGGATPTGSSGSGGASTAGSGGAAGNGGSGNGASGGQSTDAGPGTADGSGGVGPTGAGGTTGGAATGGTATGGSGTGGTAGTGAGGTGSPVDAGGSDAGSSGLDPEITGIVGAVDSGRIMTGITTLSNFTTRNTCSDNTASGNAIGAARDWIYGQFQGISGLTPSKEPFAFKGCGAGSSTTVTDQNVIAVKLGTNPDRVIVIGGHYDSRTVNATDPTGRAPGANDSGSQTAAVLEAARVMAAHTFDATIIFAAFAAEEQGLTGSAQLAKDYKNYVSPGANVEVMLNSDIVGGDTAANNATALQQFRLFSSGTPREIATPMGKTDDTSPSRGVMRYIGYWGSRYVPSMTMLPQLREDRPSRGGDQQSFLDLGYPSVRFIETVESPNAGTAGSHQHTADDLPMYVTPEYVARITQVFISVAASLARAPTPPRMATVAGNASGPWTVSWQAPASGPAVDHYIVAARPGTENFYHTRFVVPAATTSTSVSAADLGISGAALVYVSVAAVDAAGHESLFAYPEYRCDATTCVVPADALNVTARN